MSRDERLLSHPQAGGRWLGSVLSLGGVQPSVAFQRDGRRLAFRVGKIRHNVHLVKYCVGNTPHSKDTRIGR